MTMCPTWFPQTLWDQQTEATQSGIVKAGQNHELVKQMLTDYDAARESNAEIDGEADEDDPQGELSGDDNKAPPTSEDKLVSVEIANANTVAAIEAARSLDQGTLDDMAVSAVNKQKAAAVSARMAYRWLFSGNGVRNDNMIGMVLSWPKPGSSVKTLGEGSKDRPDRYSYKRDDVNINTSFYGEEFDVTPNGKAIAVDIAAIKSALPGEGRSPKAPKEWVNKCDASEDGKALLTKAIKAKESLRTYQIGWLREAVGCVRVMEAIKTKLPHLRAAIATEGYDDAGKTILRVDTNVAAPFRVYGFKKDGDVQVAVGTTYYTAKQFARLDVDKALAAGGTLTALTATVAKKAKGSGKNQTKGNKVTAISVGDVKTFESMAAEVLSFMQDNANLMMLINAVGSDKVDAHFIATIANLSSAFDSLSSKISKPAYAAAMKIIEAEKAASALVNKAKAA